jgi:hypothetical protein
MSRILTDGNQTGIRILRRCFVDVCGLRSVLKVHIFWDFWGVSESYLLLRIRLAASKRAQAFACQTLCPVAVAIIAACSSMARMFSVRVPTGGNTKAVATCRPMVSGVGAGGGLTAATGAGRTGPAGDAAGFAAGKGDGAALDGAAAAGLDGTAASLDLTA